jgi:hypothetical protein
MNDLDSAQKKAVAAEIIRQTADALTNEAIIEGWLKQYRGRIPIKEIAATALREDPDGFPGLSIPMISGVIRTKIREFVPLDVRREIEFYHRSKGQRGSYAGGRPSALTQETAKAGGTQSGNLHVARGTAIFGLSGNQRLENAKAGGVASHVAMGHTPWSTAKQESGGMSELELCMYLPTLAKFQHPNGKNKGNPNNRLIADELNRVFHAGECIRTASQVHARRSKEKNKS